MPVKKSRKSRKAQKSRPRRKSSSSSSTARKIVRRSRQLTRLPKKLYKDIEKMV